MINSDAVAPVNREFARTQKAHGWESTHRGYPFFQFRSRHA